MYEKKRKCSGKAGETVALSAASNFPFRWAKYTGINKTQYSWLWDNPALIGTLQQQLQIPEHYNSVPLNVRLA